MESYLLDWANLLLRWLHVITAIAWVGSSFYFVFLDSNLTSPLDEDLKKQGVSGELWAVHGGGFYHPVKFAAGPPQMPTRLHWFYWESYSTWLSGFALFTVSYLWHASSYLIDKSLLNWSPPAAIAAALAFLVVFWFLYDSICRFFSGHQQGDLLVAVLLALLVGAASWLACHWFAGRAAFLLVGAMLATAMSANVLFWIIPGQRKMVAAIKAGESIDPVHGLRGKQRSVHNTYFTLPVLFAMLSNHYSFLWSHPKNWLVLLVMMLSGAAIRQFFVLRHGYKLGRNSHPFLYALAGMAAIVLLVVWLKPRTATLTSLPVADSSIPNQFDYKNLEKVLSERCLQCHGAQLQLKNVRLDSPALVQQHAQSVYQQVVLSKLMPINNSTGITDAERELVRQWFEAGAKIP